MADTDPIEMSKGVKNDLEDTLDYSKLLSNVISNDIGSALAQTTDKTIEIREHLKAVAYTGKQLKVDESTFKSMQEVLTVSKTSLKNSIDFANSFTSELKNSVSVSEMQSKINDEISANKQEQANLSKNVLPAQNEKLISLQKELDANQNLLNGIDPTTSAFIQQQKEVEKINSFLEHQKGIIQKTTQEIEDLNGMQNFLDTTKKSVDASSNLSDAVRSIYKDNLQLTKQQQESLTAIGDQEEGLKTLVQQYNKISDNFKPPEVEPQNIVYQPTFNTNAMEVASDFIKEVNDNLMQGDLMANIEITGDDKVLGLIGDLTAAQEAARLVETQSSKLQKALRGTTTQSEALLAIDRQRATATKAINELTQLMPSREDEVKVQSEALAIENARLATLPEGTVAYEQQKEIVRQQTITHTQNLNQLKSEQAQHAELLKYRDEFLKNQREVLSTSENHSTALSKVLSDTSKITQEAILQVDATKENIDKVQELGDSYKNMAETLGPIQDEITNGIQNAKERVLDLAGNIPIIGGAIRKNMTKPFDDAAKVLTSSVNEGLKEMIKPLGANETYVDRLKAGFGKMAEGIKSAGAMLKSAFSGPMILVSGLLILLALAVKRFFDLESKAKEFREGLGLAAEQAKQVEKNANEVQRELAGFGVSLDHAYDAATALTEQMGSTMLVTKDQIALVAQLSASLGVAAGSAAGVYEAFLVMGDGSAETAQNLTLATTALATAAGVPLGAVMDDIANASDSVYAFSRGTGEELAIAAVEARRLGTNIESVTGSMEKALDFETSIQSEMRMATMLGRHISMDAMRRASFEGDQVKFMQEQRKVLQNVGDLSQKNMYQRQAIAEAMGMEVGELMKMQQKEKGLQALASGTAEQRRLLAEYEKMQADIQGGRVKDVAKEAEEMIRQEKAQLVKERLMNQINKIVTELGSVLLPVVESAMSVLVPIVSMLLSGFGKLVKVVEFLLQPIIFIGNVIKALTGDTEGLKSQFDGLGKSIFAISGIILGLVLVFKKEWTGVFSWLPDKIGNALEKGFTVASGFMQKYIWEPFTGLLDDMTGGLAGLFSGDAEDASEGFFGKIKNKVSGMFGGNEPEAPGPLKKDGTPDMRFKANQDALKPGAPDVSGDVVPDVDPEKGERFKELIEKFNSIDMKKVLQAAAAMLVLSSALLVTAVALTQFNKVEWQSVLKGVVAIGMLVGGLYLMSEVLKTSQANLMKGSLAILALGAALVPFAFALQMLSDVNWLSIALAGVTLVGLAIGAMILGGIASSPPFWIGIAGIVSLGVALIPFAVAAILAGVAMNLIAFAFSTMVGALQTLTIADIGTLFLLGGALVFLGSIVPFAVMATITLGAFAAAMIPLAVGLTIAGAGITLFGLGLSLVIETIKQLPMAAVAIGIFVFAMSLLAPLVPLMVVMAAGLAILGVALIPFGVGAMIAGAAMFILASAFSIMVSALESMSMGSIGMLYALGASLAFLATMLPFAILAAITLGVFAYAMIPLAIGLTMAAVAITIFGAGLSLVMDTLLQLPEATTALMGFVFGISLLAPLVPLMVLTAGGLAILGLSLIPFGIGAIIAGAGMLLIAQSLAIMSAANPAEMLFDVANAFLYLGLMSAFIGLGVIALAAMTLVLIPFSAALAVAGAGIALFGLGLSVAISSLMLLPAAAIGLVAFGIAVSLLGPMIPLILLGAVALTVMAAALIPFGASLLVVGVGLTVVSVAFYIMAQAINSLDVGNLFGLIGAFILMGTTLPIILLGAVALGVMTTMLVPFGVAAAVAGLGLMVFSAAFSMLTDSINNLDIGNFFGLIGAFVLMGSMLPIITLGAISLTIMTSALIPFGVAALIAGAGMFVFAGAFYLFATAMSMIPDGTVGTLFGVAIAMTLIGASVVAAIFASAALVTFAGGLAVFAVAAMATGAAVSVLALGMSVLANSLSQIASEGLAAIAGLAILGLISPLLFMAAGGILALSGALVVMGAAQAAAGLLSMFSSDENPFAMYIELGQHAEALNAASQGLSSIADSMSKLGEVDVGDIFEAIGEGFEEIFDVIDDIGEDTLAKFDLVAGSFKSLFSCIADILSDGLDITPLLGFMTALPMMATSIASMTSGGGGGGFFGGLFGEEEESPLDSFVNSLSSMGDAMARIAPGAEAFNTLIQTLGGSAETLVNATSGLDMLTGAVYRFSEALDELGPFGMIMLGTMSALGVSQSSQQQSAAPSTGGGSGTTDLATSSTPAPASPVAQTQNAIQTQGEGVEAQGSEASSAPSAEQMASGGVGGGSPSAMPEVVQQVASVPASAPMGVQGGGDSSGVEARLDELIGLLKSGKLGVNLDGKKVEKQLAKAAP